MHFFFLLARKEAGGRTTEAVDGEELELLQPHLQLRRRPVGRQGPRAAAAGGGGCGGELPVGPHDLHAA